MKERFKRKLVVSFCLVLEGNEMKIRTNINFPILVSEERGKKKERKREECEGRKFKMRRKINFTCFLSQN